MLLQEMDVLMRYLVLILLIASTSFAALEEVSWQDNKRRKLVTVTADDQVVSFKKQGELRIDSDDGTAANRSFVLDVGKRRGQEVLVLCFDNTNQSEIVDDASIPAGGLMKLTATWTCTEKFDSIRFRFSGSPGDHWYEVSRSDN